MSEFTVIEVLPEKREFDTRYGPMVAHKVKIEGEQGSGLVEIKQKPETPPPTMGQTLQGEIMQKPGFTPEFKKDKPAYSGQSNGGGSRPRDPKETAAIVRQHSQHMAILWAAVLQKEGLQPNPDSFKPWLKGLIDWFDSDVQGAGDSDG